MNTSLKRPPFDRFHAELKSKEMVNNMKTLILIPAYNEAKNIVQTVVTLQKECPDIDYVIVNDGSKDETALICRENNLKLLDLPINLGLAGAFQLGMQYAFKHGYDAVLQFDGDGQHKPEYIAELCNTLSDNDCDIVIGSRFLDGKKSFSGRMVGSSFLSFLILIVSRVKITDPTSGMRLYNKKLINEFAWNPNYDPEPDTLAYLMRTGVKVKEVAVTMKEREHGESYLNFTAALKYMLRTSISILFIQWFRKRGLTK